MTPIARKAPPAKLELDVMMYQEKGLWVAHCVALDILTSTPSKSDTLRDIKDLICGQIQIAIVDDPNFEHLFKPISPELSKQMSIAMANDPAVIDLEIHVAHKASLTVETRVACLATA